MLRQMIFLTFDILDGGERGPKFRIRMEFTKGYKGLMVEGYKPSKAWKQAFDRLTSIEKDYMEGELGVCVCMWGWVDRGRDG